VLGVIGVLVHLYLAGPTGSQPHQTKPNQPAPPRRSELDLLRVRMLQEVEAPHRAKCARLVQEAEAAQEAFVRVRREHEALQNAHKVSVRAVAAAVPAV